MRFFKHCHSFGKLLLSILLIMALFTLPVQAADTDTAAAEQLQQAQTNEDLFHTLIMLQYYSLYDFIPGEYADASTAEEVIGLLREKDEWAMYFDAESYAAYSEDLEGSKVGIGIYYLIEDGAVNVTGIIKGGAAETAGLLAGDSIIAVNDMDIAPMNEGEIKAAFAGEEGTTLTVTVMRDGEKIDFTLIRAPFVLQSVYYELLDDGIAYVQLGQFTYETADEFLLAYYELMSLGAKGLILDLRNCPGGTVDSAVDIICMLCDVDIPFYLEYRDSYSLYRRSCRRQINLPMVTLINENSASAAEYVAGSLQDCGRSMLIGTTTYGKGLMQNVFALPSGAGFKFTSARFLTAGRQDIAEQGGIYPDIYVSGEDAQLAKAIDTVRLQTGCADMLLLRYNTASALVDGVLSMDYAAPFAMSGISYLPLADTLELMGYESYYYDGSLYLSYGSRRVVIDMDTHTAISGKLVYPIDFTERDGLLYAPSNFWREVLDLKLLWQKSDNSLLLIKNN